MPFVKEEEDVKAKFNEKFECGFIDMRTAEP